MFNNISDLRIMQIILTLHQPKIYESIRTFYIEI